MTSIFGSLWIWLLFACFVVFIVVIVSLREARKMVPYDSNAPVPSIIGWILLSVCVPLVWALVMLLMIAFGLVNSDFLSNLVLFAGPTLYLYLGYRWVNKANSARDNHSSQDTHR